MALNTSNRGRRAILGAAILAAAAFACLSLGAQGLDSRLVAKADGPSGLKWIGGDRESPLMRPGMSCIGCHSRGEGPRFQVAGTVYTNIDEKDEYFGVEGLVVQVTDAVGTVAKYPTNKAGNFYSGRSPSLKAPFAVKVLGKKGENPMASPAPSGDCASCHTAKGANGAPGRVIAP
jgi:hypothetical protein